MAMKTIWKYTWDAPNIHSSFAMPQGAVVLHVHEQNDVICLWALIDTKVPKKLRRFALCGTGHLYPAGGQYVGSVHLSGGQYVFHVFEVEP